jgi:threonine dehydrogenase-like Zn-dependent dehydrogenase
MKSVAVLSPGKVGIVEVPRPEPGPYEALVKSEIAFICNATDRKVVAGHFPGMGADAYPLILGHETVGRVVAVGAKVRSFAVGARVLGGLVLKPSGYGSGWGGDSEYVLAADHEAMAADGLADEAHGWAEVYKIMRAVPEDIPVEAAGLLATWREVYAGFSDFHLRAGDDILIFGAGPVGLSFCRFAKLLGLGWVGVVDTLAFKREKALAMGADAVFAPDDPAIPSLAKSRGKALDAVVDAVGSERVINAALPLIKLGGSVCVYGVLAGESLTLAKGTAPYNFNLYMHQWPTRDAEAAAQEPLIEWIRAGYLRHQDFVTGVFALGDIEAALAATEKPTSIKTMLRFAGAQA